MGRFAVFVFALAIPAFCADSDWEATGAVGFGLYHPLTYTAPAGTAQEGIGPRYAIEVEGGRHLSDRFLVELQYAFQDGDFELSSGGRKTAFDANAHAISGNLLTYISRSHRWRP